VKRRVHRCADVGANAPVLRGAHQTTSCNDHAVARFFTLYPAHSGCGGDAVQFICAGWSVVLRVRAALAWSLAQLYRMQVGLAAETTEHLPALVGWLQLGARSGR
jgi:hypothetical protein